jgi:ATP-binding cassette subfamily B protein
MINNSEYKLGKLLIRLWGHLNGKRKRQIFLLIILMPVGGILELINFGAVLPLLSLLINPENLFKYPFVQIVSGHFLIITEDQIIFALVVFFCIITIISALVRVMLLKVITNTSLGCGADLCNKAFRVTLNQPIIVHMNRHTSTVISGILGKVSGSGNTLLQILFFINSSLIIIFVTIAMLVVDATVTWVLITGFGGGYWVMSWLSKRELKKNSTKISIQSEKMVKALQEGLGGIRDILLDGTQSVFCNIFQKADEQHRSAQGRNNIIAGSPRFLMEALGIVLICLVAYYYSYQYGGATESIPLLAAFALGAQRLLPALQQCYSAISTILGSQKSLIDALEILDQRISPSKCELKIPVIQNKNLIELQGVSFKYSEEKAWVIDQVSLVIPKGARVAIVGETGSGKSTLLDILMGLLIPSEGKMLIEGNLLESGLITSYQKNIAHVPQIVYLTDSTLEDNIAFGILPSDIDHERVRKVAQQARIADFIENLPEGFKTNVGESGSRLSGGQRQRIGIARALYKNAKILFLDEFTSALDEATEKSVMQEIEALDREITIFIVSHRNSTIQKCDLILELKNGKIIKK